LDIVSKGGNYLLNVGPKADGTIPEQSTASLAEIGKWMKINGEAVYATKGSPFPTLSWGRCTRKEDEGNTTLYLSVFDWPQNGNLDVPGLSNEVMSAKLLTNGKSLKTSKRTDGITVSVPEKMPDPIATVIKLEVKGVVNATSAEAKKAMKTGELD
jgi:alpha-L-fucosidase